MKEPWEKNYKILTCWQSILILSHTLLQFITKIDMLCSTSVGLCFMSITYTWTWYVQLSTPKGLAVNTVGKTFSHFRSIKTKRNLSSWKYLKILLRSSFFNFFMYNCGGEFKNSCVNVWKSLILKLVFI